MSTKHLTVGSIDPPRTEGILRIYSMKICPFAGRALTILLVKNIPHEIVNINLDNKPEWYTQRVPTGKVPALIDGSKVIVESLQICDYIDEKYPEPRLYPADPAARKNDKEIIEKFSATATLVGKCIYDEYKTPLEEWTKLLLESLKDLENELGQRGTTFFGGKTPAMVDYMIYPFAERAECLSYKFGQKLPIKDTDIPLLQTWKKAMYKLPVIQQRYISGEVVWRCILPKLSNQDQIFDED